MFTWFGQMSKAGNFPDWKVVTMPRNSSSVGVSPGWMCLGYTKQFLPWNSQYLCKMAANVLEPT
eukprot:3295425-Amphidinium_carterae.1